MYVDVCISLRVCVVCARVFVWRCVEVCVCVLKAKSSALQGFSLSAPGLPSPISLGRFPESLTAAFQRG